MSRLPDFGDLVTFDGRDAEVVGRRTEPLAIGVDYVKPPVEYVTLEFEDGSEKEVLADHCTDVCDWTVPLGKKDGEYSPWRVELAQQGSGLAICVDRGISCEAHTHVLTRHTSNLPSYWAVRDACEKLRPELEKQIDGFVNFVRTVGYGNERGSAFKDSVGVLFMQFLLDQVAAEIKD